MECVRLLVLEAEKPKNKELCQRRPTCSVTERTTWQVSSWEREVREAQPHPFTRNLLLWNVIHFLQVDYIITLIQPQGRASWLTQDRAQGLIAACRRTNAELPPSFSSFLTSPHLTRLLHWRPSSQHMNLGDTNHTKDNRSLMSL